MNHRIQQLQKELQKLRNGERDDEAIKRESEIILEIDEWIHREEILWKQS